MKLIQLDKADLVAQNVLFGELIDMFTTTPFPKIDFKELSTMNPRLRTFPAWLEQFGEKGFKAKKP